MSKTYDENDMQKNLLIEQNETLQQPSINKSFDINLSWENLNVKLRSNKNLPLKPVLINASGYAKCGDVTAIMGPSGAGKSTMLGMISQRIVNNENTSVEGQMKINNGNYNAKIFSRYAAFILQDDILLESLTVRETISFAANLKLKTSQHEKDLKVQNIIKQLQLQKCQDTPVGGVYVKGISGGQRKRTNIGVELVGDPNLIVLDEPTSGLDSFTAYLLINILQNMAQKERKNIVMTIHQPSSEIFAMIDRLILLRNGQIVYQGVAKNIVSYLNSVNLHVPKFSNPPDFFMKCLTSSDSSEYASKLSASNFKSSLQGDLLKEMHKLRGQETGLSDLVHNSIGYQISQIMGRSFTNFIRNPMYFQSKLGTLFFLVFLIASLWWMIGNQIPSQPNTVDNNTTYIFNVAGGCFMLGTAIFMSVAMTITLVFPNERAVFLKEENSGMYRISSYFVGKMIVELPYIVLYPLILNSILYWLIAFPAKGFIAQTIILILISLTANGLGFMNGSIFSNQRIAVAMTPLLIMPFFLFAGFYSNLGTIPSWIGWIQYLSPFQYFFNALVLNFFEYKQLQNQLGPFVVVPVNVKQQFGFNLSVSECCFILLAIAVGFHLIALISLKIQTKKII